MISQLEAFASDEQGLRFLLNLYWGLRDNSMKAVCPASAPMGPNWRFE
jgi:hypothetical protein